MTVAARRKQWRGMIAVAVVLLVLTCSWWAWSIPPAETSRRVVLSVRPVTRIEAVRVEPPSETLPASAAAALVDGEIELCGGLRVRPGPDGSVDLRELEQAAGVRQLRERVMAALRAEGSPRSSAAAVLIRASGEKMDADAGDDLARIALLGTDPQVYAWALQTCDGANRRSAGACAQLSSAQWARLDSDNATPWIAVLDEAGRRNDAAGMNEALHRIATSRGDVAGGGALAREINGLTGTSETDLLAAMLLTAEALNAVPMPSYSGLLKMCRGDALHDWNRQQECAAAAEVLIERGDTLTGRRIGTALGRYLGWPHDRIDRVRGEMAAYIDSINPIPGTPESLVGITVGCSDLGKELDRARRIGQIGEVGVLCEWLASPDRPSKNFMLEERVRREQLELKEHARGPAEAASAAASAAAAQQPTR